MTAQLARTAPDGESDGVTPVMNLSVEDYAVDPPRAEVRRSLLDRNGVWHSSVVTDPSVERTEGLPTPIDVFDAAWLRARQTPATIPSGDRVTVADLFSGCGGLSVGASEACRALGRPVEHVFAADADANALAVYGQNFPAAQLHDQPIETFLDGQLGDRPTRAERQLSSTLSGLTLAMGGPPCQGHSDLNNHTRRADPKNALYLRMVRFAEVVRPTNLVVENVPGVVHDTQGVVTTAITTLQDLGYRVTTAIVRASDIGVPQTRRRHLLLATLDRDSVADATMLSARYGSPTRPVMWAISDLMNVVGTSAFDTSATHSATNKARIEYLFDNFLHDLPDALRPDCHRLKPHSYKAVYGRMHAHLPAPTITSGFGSTGQGRFVHPFVPRTLTPHEAARVQGFPDHFSFAAAPGRQTLQRMIGNAVHSRLGYAAAADLLR